MDSGATKAVRAAPLILSVWPGLARLWLRGQGTSLGVAIAFGGLLQFALVATFVWPHVLWRGGPMWLTPAVAWFLVLGFWIGGIRSALGLRREIARQAKGNPQAVEPLLRQAQIEYLKGHWIEAESLLRKLLEDRPSDAEAHLLLVTLYRRTGRTDDARRQLKDLLELSSAGRWADEIEAEARRLKGAQSPEATPVVLKALGRAA